VLIGEQEFNIAEYIVGSRRLIDVKATDVDAAPIELGGIDLVAPDIDAKTVAFKNIGIPSATPEERVASSFLDIVQDLLCLD